MAVQYFLAVLTQTAGRGPATLYVVDVPEVTCRGRDPEDAIARGQGALQLALDARAEKGIAIPPASALDDHLFERLDAEQRRDFKFFFLLAVNTAEPAVRLDVSLPGDLARRIDSVAGAQGRSAWLAAAVREKLARQPDPANGRSGGLGLSPKPRAEHERSGAARARKRNAAGS